MANKPNYYTKHFDTSFVLDRAKLSRMLDVISEKYEEADLEYYLRYEVVLDNAKNIYLNSVEEVLELDNSVSNPIASLTLKAFTEKKEKEKEKQDKDEKNLGCLISYDNAKKRNVTLNIVSKDVKKANQLFAELEEQVERTLAKNWVYKYLKRGSIFIFGFLGATILSLLGVLLLEPQLNNNLQSLSQVQADSLSQKINSISSNDEKIDFIFQLNKMQIENLKANDSLAGRFVDIFTIQNFFILLPFLIMVGCLIYMIKNCYPHAIFLWGDYEGFYNKLMRRKRTLWTVVIASLLIGIISSLFVLSISSYLGNA